MNGAPVAAVQTADWWRMSFLKRVFSFPAMIACLLAVLAELTSRLRFDDPDMWWHLKMGEVIWTTHTIPTSDLFSYTTNHHAYTAHEWLSQLLIYSAFRIGGYSGLMLWFCIATSAVLIAGYALCSLYSENAKVAFAGAMTIWFFATIGFSIRPQLIGYFLLIVELLLLHLGRTRNPRWFFCLPPLFVIWANCHGSFSLGIAVVGLLLFSSYFNFQCGSLVTASWDRRGRRMLMVALALSVVALFLNPVGVKLILYPLDALLKPSIGVSMVSEWQPLQLSDVRGLGLLGVLGCISLLVIARWSELFWHEVLFLALGTWLAVSHRRMLFPFGILAAPVLSRLLASSWDKYDPAQDRPPANAFLIATSLLVAFWAFPNRQNLAAQVEEKSPVKAVEYIEAHHLSGPILNEWLYGGYLIWAAPDHPVFIDGRGDVFEWAGVLSEYEQWAELQSAPNVLLDKYKINFCLLARGSPMAVILQLLHNWTVVYSDSNSVILVRSGPATPSG